MDENLSKIKGRGRVFETLTIALLRRPFTGIYTDSAFTCPPPKYVCFDMLNIQRSP